MVILWNIVLCFLLLNFGGFTEFIIGLGNDKMAGNIGGYVSPSFVFDPNAIVSGMITSGDLAPNTVYSGNIASGQIGNIHIQDGTIITADIASGQVQSGQLSSGAVTGQAGGGAFNIASGTITTNDLSSGTIITRGRYVFDDSLTCVETISGVRAVAVNQSGYIQIAMASVSGRMPAVGIVQNNFLSGATVTYYSQGKFQFSSGMVDYSGRIGKPVWVGRSGHLITASGAWNSGGFVSGDLAQTLGIILNSGSIWASVTSIVQSGDLVNMFGVIG